MGWAYGINKEGRKVGYSVKATCDHPGCGAEIDRGLAYVCGGMHDGGEFGCGKYYCLDHLYFSHYRKKFLCAQCFKEISKEEEEAMAEWLGLIQKLVGGESEKK